MQNQIKIILVLWVTCLLLSLAVIPVFAADNSVTIGYEGIPTIQYERNLFKPMTVFFSYSYTKDSVLLYGPVPFFEGEASIANIGVKLYLPQYYNHGLYVGLSMGSYYFNGKTFLIFEIPYNGSFQGYQTMIGYKNVFNPNITVDVGIIYDTINDKSTMSSGSWTQGLSLNLKLGYSW
jgi:hypothetical protein